MTARHLYQNSVCVYVATSPGEASQLFAADVGETVETLDDPFEQVADDEGVEVACDEPSGEPGEEKREVRSKDGKPHGHLWFQTKLAGVWADEFGGVGHFSGEP